MTYFKRNKYKAIKQEFNGRVYHSKKEARYAQELELRKRIGEIKEIIPQFKIPLIVHGQLVGNYFIDFKVKLNDNTYQLIEVKVVKTPLYKFKIKLFHILLNQNLIPGVDAKITTFKEV